MDMRGQLTDPKAALAFMLAGKAFITLRSLSSGNRYTYKITAAKKRKPEDPDTWFVKLLNGSDNANNYVYIGIIRARREFSWTSKSHVSKDAPSILGITFVVRMLAAGSMNGFEVWHDGRCGRCGKKLTVPESVASGFGPDCLGRMGAPPAIPQSEHSVVVATGMIAPERGLNFDGSVRQEPVKANGSPIGETVIPNSNRPALLDAEIRRRITEYKANGPENYYQDGELDEKQAFNIAYNKFRVQVERESV